LRRHGAILHTKYQNDLENQSGVCRDKAEEYCQSVSQRWKEERVQRLLGERLNPGLIALAFLAASCVSLSASAEIFKCVAKDGSPLYQNFPCQFDSIGWVPSSLDIAKAAAKPGDATQ
jgi:hypothetical protein